LGSKIPFTIIRVFTPDIIGVKGEDSDELDTSVSQSDERAIQEVIDSMTGDVEDDNSSSHELRRLTKEEIDLGCHSLTKVAVHFIVKSLI
jgi:hypothetical protein